MPHCFGRRAFKFLQPEKAPTVVPDSGLYVGRLTVSAIAPASATVRCTIDGSQPNANSVQPPFMLGGGEWLVRCLASSSFKGDSEVVEARYDIDTQAPAPEIDPSNGTGVESLEVVLSSTLMDVVIRYTLDGSKPTSENGEVYTDPIRVVTTGSVIKAVARARGLDDSEVVTSQPYSIRAAEPVLSVNEGQAIGAQRVHVSVARASEHALCTLDGSDPREAGAESTRCDGEDVEVRTDGAQIRAVAMGADVEDSEVLTSHAYVIQAQPPTFDPDGGEFEESVAAEIVMLDDDSVAWYRLVGADDAAFAKYDAPIIIETTFSVIESYVERPGKARSPTQASSTFTILTSPPSVSPDHGIFTGMATVTISSESPDTAIFYTTDGSVPSERSTAYTGPFPIAKSGTIVQTVAIQTGKSMSKVMSTAIFEITAPAPSISEEAGPSPDTKRVFIDCPGVRGARITYTLDGSNPQAFSTPYQPLQGILLQSTGKIVHALCMVPDMLPSAIARYIQLLQLPF